ncbi:hypothetical protein [Jeongeupia sp. USM3]|uniref:hypothetical protein n=1 Tax=Jeongeupia sp. USM3 TaxID=1906741 RepID=UPI00089DEE3C|nr:hypothetical protein [Jeongeupia sp. USM3]AOX99683.1 hypothetical protein BJP62_03960 [Jeongeupia sp. USM3]
MVELKHESRGNSLVQGAERLFWAAKQGLRHFTRRFGLWGWGLMLCLVLSLAASVVIAHQTARIRALEKQLSDTRHVARPASVPAINVDGRAKLKAFADLLPAYEAIPAVVTKLLSQAEAQHLQVLRGEYKPQLDEQGQFLRYRMTLPVKGDAGAIHRFMSLALRDEKTLALESIQFKREKPESFDIEAQIQWLVFTKSPQTSGYSASAVAAKAAR